MTTAAVVVASTATIYQNKQQGFICGDETSMEMGSDLILDGRRWWFDDVTVATATTIFQSFSSIVHEIKRAGFGRGVSLSTEVCSDLSGVAWIDVDGVVVTCGDCGRRQRLFR